jgi:hypothetical protein
MNAMDQGAGNAPDPTATDPNATPDAGAGLKQVMITAKADGSFDVQPMQDGQPVGDPNPAASIDDAMQGAQDALGVSGGDQGANPDQAGDQGTGDNPDATGDTVAANDQSAVSPDDQAAMEDAKKKYAQKRGTRPKTPPTWGDYQSGGNPAAQ